MRCPCESGVTNTKACQDHLSVMGPLCEGTPSFDGGVNQGQLIASSPVGVQPALAAKTHGLFGRSKDRGLDGAGIRYWRADEDWPIWERYPPFHCQAVPHGMGPSKTI